MFDRNCIARLPGRQGVVGQCAQSLLGWEVERPAALSRPLEGRAVPEAILVHDWNHSLLGGKALGSVREAEVSPLTPPICVPSGGTSHLPSAARPVVHLPVAQFGGLREFLDPVSGLVDAALVSLLGEIVGVSGHETITLGRGTELVRVCADSAYCSPITNRAIVKAWACFRGQGLLSIGIGFQPVLRCAASSSLSCARIRPSISFVSISSRRFMVSSRSACCGAPSSTFSSAAWAPK